MKIRLCYAVTRIAESEVRCPAPTSTFPKFPTPKCVLCMKTLANSCFKTIPAQAAFEQCSQGASYGKSIEYFKSKEGCLKGVRRDAGDAFHQTTFSMVVASCVVALRIAKAKKPHNIAEILVKSCLFGYARIVLDGRACNKLKQ